MKLIVERTGGFGNIKKRGERDGHTLSAEQRAALEEVMQRKASLARDPGADRFTYRIEVQDETGAMQVTVPESALPQILKDIVSN